MPRRLVIAKCAWIAAASLTAQTEDWWSRKPLAKVQAPVTDAAWERTPIDAFIRQRLRAAKLEPSPEADRRTLIRRVMFDLLGLPPTPDEIAAFENDPAADAYERLVDRLLASPRYGERQARYWLDVVHYGETHGYDKDKLRPNAWPYRDWVIRAYNDDEPYGDFVRDQLAGDVFRPGTADGILALGFIAAGPWDFVGHTELREGTVDKDITRSLDRDDMVHTAMSTFVSTTVSCARCHNHKFDPIPQLDYYRLQAVFAGIERGDRTYAPAQPDHYLTASNDTLGYHSAIAASPDAVKWVQVDLGRDFPLTEVLLYPSHEAYGGHAGPGFGFPKGFRIDVADDAAFAKSTTIADCTTSDYEPPGDTPQRFECAGRRARFVRVTATHLFERTADWIFALGELVVVADGENVAAEAAVTALDSIEAEGRWGTRYLTDGMAIRTGLLVYAATPLPGEPRPIHVLARGDVRQPGALAEPGALSCLPQLAHHFDLAPDTSEGERRAALARWITDADNPLTWRSIVNRVWQQHFETGIVDTPNDFGRMGGLPTHPELLDWLAIWFRDHGGSFKQLHRLMVTSAVYRQASASRGPDDAASQRDAGNSLLWRMPRRRREAEAIRDAMLSCSGKLDLTMGGPSVRWFGFEDDHSPRYRYEDFDPDADGAWRRSIYRHIVRSVPDPFFETLDCADASALTPRRYATLTPLQALALLNDRFVLRQAEHFAARLQKESTDLDGQIERAFALALGRSPTAEETKTLATYAERHGLPSLCRLVFNLNEFLFVD